MEKLVYGLWRQPDQDLGAMRSVLLNVVAPRLLELGVAGLRICVEEPIGRAYRVGAQPDGAVLAASVSLWIDNYDDRAPHEEAIGAANAQSYGWIVAESVARGYGEQRSWPDGERSPGLSITTFFDKKDGVDDDTFYRIWHGEHTPLSFVIHPFWLYVRNQTLRAVTPGAPRVRGIVYEAVPHDEDMLDFTRFFGCASEPEKLMDQIAIVNNHMDTFGNRRDLQCVAMREWIFKTFST
ncbi:MAG: hypothetical protein EXQ71_03430 [Acidimicrobiia bacterium]|nr:hypothetical protein [Acidimicrobiia bacterium]